MAEKGHNNKSNNKRGPNRKNITRLALKVEIEDKRPKT